MMTKEDLLNELIKIHSRYSFERYQSDESSQFCTMWPINDPPDSLTDTDQLEEICTLIEMDVDEDYAVELFDMTLEETADSLYQFLQSNMDN